MLVINIHRAEVQVLSTASSKGDKVKVIVLVDPATGIQVHAPLPIEVANEVAEALTQAHPLDAG